MKRLLLGLLKLLLQLLIFAVAGKWVRIGDPQPKPSSRKQSKRSQRAKPPKLPERAGRGPLFDPMRKPGAYEDVREPERTWRSVEEEAAEQRDGPRSIEALAGADEPRAKRGKRKRRRDAAMSERRAKPPALPTSVALSTRPRDSLAVALRDPLRVRQALILGAALGPHRPRR